ncbi:signal peptidase I [Streptomyces abyssomicinicus]|uniref:signal peptidase I n=1 Tax=Streptomyces abyssomicinicus TaxID=574929 RepID=UPI00124F7F1D|nr:signal peptidase I [Streptomyces abyssomicinicus]
MGRESGTETAVTRGGDGAGGTSGRPPGGRLGQRLSGLVVALGTVLFLGGFGWAALVYVPFTVPTPSMHPTIAAGDRVLAERVDGSEVRRGDVVVFEQEEWADAPLIKRVVAVGGDTVSCCAGGGLTVNGKRIDEPYTGDDPFAAMASFSEVTVPEGRLFLLGDDRTGSLDSTAHLAEKAAGTVSRNAVKGRVDAVAWPMDGMLEPATGFRAVGDEPSVPGPLRTQVTLAVAGALLIFAGAAYGPVAGLLTRRRGTARAGG